VWCFAIPTVPRLQLCNLLNNVAFLGSNVPLSCLFSVAHKVIALSHCALCYSDVVF